jgi:hypothetical protein
LRFIGLIAIFITSTWLIVSCQKEVVISPIPQIEFIGISPSTAQAFKDSITITVKYTDGDGDLGENNPDVENLYVTDNRIGIIYKYRIKQLAPSNSTVSITGNLNVVIKNSVVTNGSSSETATFSVYMLDRALNKSNTITTSPITITQ